MNNNNNNTSDNNTKTMSEQSQYTAYKDIGVKLTQRPITSSSERKESPEEFINCDQVIQEVPWTLSRMLERPNFIDSLAWPSTSGSHTVLGKFRVPHDLVDVNALTSAPFKSFLYWNGNIKVHMQVAGAPNVSGLVGATFIPLTNTRFIDASLIPNFSALFLNPTNFLYANANTNAIMDIPFNSPYSYLNIQTTEPVNQENTLGYLYFTVFNPLKLSTSSTDNVSISIFSTFHNNKFKAPRQSGVTKVRTVKAQSSENVPSKPGPLGLLGDIAKSVLPSNITGTIIDAGLGLIGLDKPIDPRVSEPSKLLSTQPMNFNSGIERIDKMTLQGSDIASIDQDTFSTTRDEMAFNHLFQKLSYLGSFEVSGTNTIGTVVAEFPMNPIPTRIVNGELSRIPLLSYLSIPFEFWRGDLSFQIQMVGTSLQTCKLYISFNYAQYTTGSNVLDVNTSQYGVALEVNQGSNEFNFTIPYISNTHALHVPSSNEPSAFDTMGMMRISVLNPLVSTNGSPESMSFNVFMGGSENFHLDTLSASKNLYPYFPVQLSKSQNQKKIRYVEEEPFSESDIEVIEITTPIRRKSKVVSTKAQSSEPAQPLITPLVDTDEVQDDEPIAPTPVTRTRQPNAQDYIPGVKDLLNKYQMIDRLRLRDPTTAEAADVHVIRISDYFGYGGPLPSVNLDPALPGSQYRGLFTHFQPIFRQFKGGLNFKIMPVSVDIAYTMSVFYQPPVYNKTTSSTPINWVKTFRNQLYRNFEDPLAYNHRNNTYQLRNATRLPIHYVNGVTKTAEFSIPFSSRLNSILSKTGPNSENELESVEITDLGYLVIYYNIPETTVFDGLIEFDMFMSLSDEARLGTLFNVPQVAVNSYRLPTGAIDSSPYPDDYGSGAPVVNTLKVL